MAVALGVGEGGAVGLTTGEGAGVVVAVTVGDGEAVDGVGTEGPPQPKSGNCAKAKTRTKRRSFAVMAKPPDTSQPDEQVVPDKSGVEAHLGRSQRKANSTRTIVNRNS